jgi:hypothetical protein
MANYDDVDLEFTYDGDFVLGADGDLKDTVDDALRSLRQEIQSVCNSELGDWQLYSTRAATLSDFVGEPNSRSTAKQIHDRVRAALLSHGVVNSSDLQIRVFPVHRHKVLIAIRVNADSSVFNSLEGEKFVVVQVLFNFRERGVTFYEQVPDLI